VIAGQPGDLLRAADVHAHGFGGIILQHGHMLVGRRMENYLRAKLGKEPVQRRPLGDIRQIGNEHGLRLVVE